ncbi:GntR family transcriptional regulator [Anaeromicropila herbilytica]|uniref:GntR family transcriptional regulator n=1 Tax=Anaeromicropila herbilytica TaxID=2785025 RepID=A0A7R7IC52_9FIRM|nr:GntR family transcriptional regulator [Anaeromicropila herbilytica]BCN30363.1 GntR family transcriptional regulator [Anaeromicropila herbilytica]
MIIKLDFESEIPIYLQIRNEVVKGIGKGQLAIGEQLPTVRSLANDIGINAMTVNKAYALLKKEGFITIERRHGAKISPRYQSNIDYSERLVSELDLLTSEAAIRGCDKETFLRLCEQVYQSIHVRRLEDEKI